MTKQTIKRYRDALKANLFIKTQIDQVCRMKREEERNHDSDRFELITLIKHQLKKGIDITPEQTKLGIEWLNKYAFRLNGKPRKQKDNPFTDDHRAIISNFSHFVWCGLKDINHTGNYGHYRPMYKVVSKDGSYFIYVPNVPFNGAPISYCSGVTKPGIPPKKKALKTFVKRQLIDALDKKLGDYIENGIDEDNDCSVGSYSLYTHYMGVGAKLIINGTRHHNLANIKSSSTALRDTEAFNDAKREFEIIKQAESSGVTPYGYGAHAIKTSHGWVAVIFMEHCGITVEEADLCEYEVESVMEELKETLEESTGIYHQDVHERNVVYLDGTYKLIDFSPSWINAA